MELLPRDAIGVWAVLERRLIVRCGTVEDNTSCAIIQIMYMGNVYATGYWVHRIKIKRKGKETAVLSEIQPLNS